MLDYFANILSGSTVQGSGPITSITEWSITRRMDAAGSWSLTMSAADAQASQVVLKRNLKIYAYIDGAYTLVGGGIIDRIVRQVAPDGTETLALSGGDDLRELTTRTVGALTIQDVTSAQAWGLIQQLGAVTGVTDAVFNGLSRMIAGTNTGSVYRSTDYGLTWTWIQQLGSEGNVERLFLVPYTNPDFYALTDTSNKMYGGGIWGSTWSLVTQTFYYTAGPSVYEYASSSTIWLMSTTAAARIYKYTGAFLPTTIAGGAWVISASTFGSETSINAILWLSATDVICGTAAHGDIYISANAGTTWAASSVSPFDDVGETDITKLILLASGRILAGTSPNAHIYISDDDGDNWADSTTGQLGSETSITSLVQLADGDILAGTSPGGTVYRSTDDGANWTLDTTFTGATDVTALIDMGGGFVIASVAGAAGEIWRAEPAVAPATHAGAVAQLEAYAPTDYGTWSFVPDASPGNDDLFVQFAGESLLAAVLLIAERSGGHCYLSGDHELTFDDTWTASNIAAIAPRGNTIMDSSTAAIVGLTVQADSYDLVTRVYPFGRDADRNRLSIGTTDIATDATYTVDSAAGYVEHKAGAAEHGQIDRWIVYDDVVSSTTETTEAANALVKAAQLLLADVSSPVTTYSIELANCTTLLRPLQYIRVTYTGDTILDEADLYITESTWRGDATGLMTTAVTAADAPVRMMTDAEAAARTMQRVTTLAAR